MFDPGKTGFIETNRVAAIFNTIEQKFNAEDLKQAINEYDKDSKYQVKQRVLPLYDDLH
jgi:Ca2+-binding EF-hand superfamily protein